jgi:predicted NAD-dependent protein-ADP-ribosyltransferase YbiA (DUF1768 family)
VEVEMIDIHSKSKGLAGKLSNFTNRQFIFDGIKCECLEGPIQSFKFEDPEIQKQICKLSGREAKIKGQERNEDWQSTQTVWWLGKSYARDSKDFWELLKRLFLTVYSLEEHKKDLLATKGELLVHSIGGKSQKDTVLTESEFCFLLMLTREALN